MTHVQSSNTKRQTEAGALSETGLIYGREQRLFVGGCWREPSGNEVLQVISPSTERVIGEVMAAENLDVDAAVSAAREAFDNGVWPRLSMDERLQFMRRLSLELKDIEEALAHIITDEVGCPISQSRTIQTSRARDHLDSFIDLAPEVGFQSIRTTGTFTALVTKEPVGVVAAVIPWNVPLAIAILKIAPALIAGCTVVLKPAPETPLNSYRLADAVEKAGFPEGVVSILPAGREVSEYVVTHPGVDKVSFTGSSVVGRRIAELSGKDLKRVTLELGGKSAAIVLDDADLERAVESLRHGALRNSGQVCSGKTRIVVSRRNEAEVVDRLAAMMSAMKVGDPSDVNTDIGPMISRAQRTRVEKYVEIGVREGAQLVIGGERPDLAKGWYVAPTLFRRVTSSMRIAQEEVFGPVLSVIAYDTEEEAIRIANDSQYGLNGSVFSADPDRALRVARQLRTGTVEINGAPAGLSAPAGGFKRSGLGREGGVEGFDAYVEMRSLGLDNASAARFGV